MLTRGAGIIAACLFLLSTCEAEAAIKTETIRYKAGQVDCVGFLAYDDASTAKRPGVLVVHEWWGLNDYARNRAKALAAEGYVAFACDMYGQGATAEHPKAAGEMAAKVRANSEEWQARAKAGLKILSSHAMCDADNLAAIGYCFGGSTALQLAYSGADLKAVATFHAALPTPTAEQAKSIKPTILVCHGAQDNFIPEESIQKFRTALEGAQVDYQLVYYAGTVHSFTVPDAGKHGLDGMKYNAAADKRSWESLKALLKEKFTATH